MIYLNKILPHLLYPVTLILIMLIYGLIRKKRSPVIIALISLWISSTPYLSTLLFGYLERDQLRYTTDQVRPADAVVVLGGMLAVVNSHNGAMYEWADPDRYFAGLELMQAKKARYIVFSGGVLPWQSQLNSEGRHLAELAKQDGLKEDQIVVTDDVQNTAQEAIAVKNFLRRESLDSIILVTSAFHMARAEHLFKQAGISLQSYPVDSKVGLLDLTPMDFLPDANAFAATQFAFRELIGRTYYFLIDN